MTGTEAQKMTLLPDIASGATIGTLALSEGPGVPGAGRIATRYAHGLLSGTKLPVTDGCAARHAVVLARGVNFDDTPGEARYRARVRGWIAANAPDMGVLAAEENRNWHPRHRKIARQWQATKAGAGYACISWPSGWGGAGGSAIEEAIFNQEEVRAGVQFNYFMTGLHMLLPALLEHNPDARALERVPPALRGEEIWCQLFSEPASGSDSAGIRCSAARDGDAWVLNGQKVWNSGAHVADYGMVVARTDADLPKHRGLTVFWLDMKTPGVEVRPIRVMSGEAELNEVFLDGVYIPDTQRVGEVNGGWAVVIHTLMNERAALGSGAGAGKLRRQAALVPPPPRRWPARPSTSRATSACWTGPGRRCATARSSTASCGRRDCASAGARTRS
jgi:alkylation response protein AidB-like acyl-CoA dehydrogenase